MERGNFSGQWKFRLPVSPFANVLNCKHRPGQGRLRCVPCLPDPWCSPSPSAHFHQTPSYLLASTGIDPDCQSASLVPFPPQQEEYYCSQPHKGWFPVLSTPLFSPLSLPVTGMTEFKMKTWLGRCIFSLLKVFVQEVSASYAAMLPWTQCNLRACQEHNLRCKITFSYFLAWWRSHEAAELTPRTEWAPEHQSTEDLQSHLFSCPITALVWIRATSFTLVFRRSFVTRREIG